MSELMKTSDDSEPDENLTAEKKLNQVNEKSEASGIEKSATQNEIEINALSSAVADDGQDGGSTLQESNQINQKHSNEALITTTTTTKIEEETENADATQYPNNELTIAEITKATTTITTDAITSESTPAETDASNITQAVLSATPEAIKIPLKTTENNQMTKDVKACETAQRIENMAEEPQNDNADSMARITEENPATKKTAITTAGAAITAATTATTTASATTSTVDPSNEYAEHITYTEDGNAIYTDPKTDHKYKWSAKENNWLYWKSGEKLSQSNANDDNPYENEHYRWCSEKNQWIAKDAAQQVTGTQTETEHYKWDATKNAWIPKLQTQQAAVATATTAESTQPDAVTYGIDEDGQRIYTDKDGVVFFWDAEKSAWFPKIDDDFMARYQMNYGFIDNTSASEEENRRKEQEAEKQKQLELEEMVKEARAATEEAAAGGGTAASAAAASVKRKATQEPPSWFDLNPEQNTKVYVSNLPLDITLDEFAEIMSKCGMIMRDPKTQKHKLKLYTEADGQLKGDGLCDYIKIESVELALKILDEYEVRGHKIRVQRAKFQMRGEYNPALKPKRKKKDKEKLLKMKEKLFDWRPEKMRGERTKNEKVVIIKNLFSPELFEKEVQLILDYQNDLREECSKCGLVRKVVIYDMHPEGVAQINMSSPEEADLVIQMMQGRFFGKRQLTAEHWDGKTKYKIAESETSVKSRLNNWDEFLETEEESKTTSSTLEAANS